MKRIFLFTFLSISVFSVLAQTADELLQAIRNKQDKINDYQARGKLKTNIIFIKAPIASVKIFYKKPDKMRIVNEDGISFIPKGSININPNNLFADRERYEVVDAGKEPGTGFRILKLLPTDENSEIVLATLFIDEKAQLVRKAKNTTRDNGTYELEMSYGSYASFGLPDKVIFSFNIKDYKLPKGVTFDYDDGSKQNPNEALKNKKGKVEINYTEYIINKGVDDSVFK